MKRFFAMLLTLCLLLAGTCHAEAPLRDVDGGHFVRCFQVT